MNRRCCGSQAQARKKLTWVCHDSAFRETVVCTMTKLKVSEAEIQEVKDLVQYIRNANDMPPRVDTLEAVLAVAPKMDVELLVATSVLVEEYAKGMTNSRSKKRGHHDSKQHLSRKKVNSQSEGDATRRK
mmetsp:Transcript_2571/g.7708  ORF Transcript_2571/g.7708 Transcript_2571/m.7708 type:complete len:130 (-) Transcript_2571:1985-2374(-)